MSGSTGADRVKSREDFKQFIKSYLAVIKKFPGFESITPSGSYNSNLAKKDFGDIDLITHIRSDQDKAAVKKQLVSFFEQMPETVIVPFTSAKHAGRRTYNAGEIVTVRYHDPILGYSAQIDNIVALDPLEAGFKQQFLDMPAEKQGLILGLVKVAAIETAPIILFKRLGIKAPAQLPQDQEYEFNLSSSELQLRVVTYEPGTYRQQDRAVIWRSKNFDDVRRLLYQYNLDSDFETLLQQAKKNIKNPRSNARIRGVFASMITVKSGEVGTAKGAGKVEALNKIVQMFTEDVSRQSPTVVFAFGRFQPPTKGHALVVNAVKQQAQQQGADYVIYVSKTQDNKKNPLTIQQKMSYLTKMFPGTNFVACDDSIRTPIEAVKALSQRYKNLVMIAGSDRVPSFTDLLNRYNGQDYQFDNIDVISSGERDPDSDDLAGVSGTKVRQAALDGDYETVRAAVPDTVSDALVQQLIADIISGMSIKKKDSTMIKKDKTISEAEYQGRKVSLGKPFLTPDGPKKRSVYVKNSKGRVIKVNFGAKGMKIKKSIPARRKSFRARHRCDTAKDRTTARYWSCRFW